MAGDREDAAPYVCAARAPMTSFSRLSAEPCKTDVLYVLVSSKKKLAVEATLHNGFPSSSVDTNASLSGLESSAEDSAEDSERVNPQLPWQASTATVCGRNNTTQQGGGKWCAPRWRRPPWRI